MVRDNNSNKSTKIAKAPPTLSSAQVKPVEVAEEPAAPVVPKMTPVSCWANDVPDEFQTPVYHGQLPPEQQFAESPVMATTNAGEGFEEEPAYASPHDSNDDTTGSYPYEGSYDYYPDQTPYEEPAPATLVPAVVMHAWYQEMLGWVSTTDKTCNTHLPPPPPPPSEQVASHMRPYNFEQWCARMNRWYGYVMAEYYNNTIHPDAAATSAAPAPQHQQQHAVHRPPMNQYRTRAQKYPTHPQQQGGYDAVPQPSYNYYGYEHQQPSGYEYHTPPESQIQVPPAKVSHNPYGSVRMQEQQSYYPDPAEYPPLV